MQSPNGFRYLTGLFLVAGLIFADTRMVLGTPDSPPPDCSEYGPHTNVCLCLPGTITATGQLSWTNASCNFGEVILPPTITGTTFSTGGEVDYVYYDCDWNAFMNGYVTNSVNYAAGLYFVPPLPPVATALGTNVYNAYVQGLALGGSPCAPIGPAWVGTVTINVDTNNPDALLNIDFYNPASKPNGYKSGSAAVGDFLQDYWNYYGAAGPNGSLPNLYLANGWMSQVGLLVTNLWSGGTNNSSDPMYSDYLYTNGATANLTITNLPPGLWSVYVYGNNGNFTLAVGTNNYGTESCYDSPVVSQPAWQQGVQYVVFYNVPMTSGQSMTVTVNPALGGTAMISGIQIVSASDAPLNSPLPRSGLVAWWPANSNAMEVISGTTGAVYPVTTYTNGIYGEAFNFDGAGGCVLNPAMPRMTNIQNTFTMEFWANPQKGINLLPQGVNLESDYGDRNQNYAIFPDYGGTNGITAGAGVSVGTNGICVIEHADGYLPSNLSYTNTVSGWTHVAVVYTNQQPWLYVNGMLVQTGVMGNHTIVYPSANLGGHSSFPWKYYGPYLGALGNVMIYNRALTANEIADDYAAGIFAYSGNVIQQTNYNGVPDRWLWEYFGTTAISGTNLDYSGNGNTFAQDFSNNVTPTVFTFTGLSVTNNYVNTNSPNVQLNMAGYPYYIAVSVDDTNYQIDALWQNFTGSNVTVNLGTNEGWHDVWIGMRGFLPGATVTWQWKHINLALPPRLTITAPVGSVVSQPMIQIYGYCQDSLASISYDTSNATGIAVGQSAAITDRFYDTNVLGSTTNYFECLDVQLTNGLNIVTIHATDLSGNTTTTNFNFTLDYSGKTNPPALQIEWPQNGTLIGGTNFTCRGIIEDPTTTITALNIITNGATNSYSAIVERNGKFWFENLPIHNGTNIFTLIAKDVVGNVNVTNISVLESPLFLTINPLANSSQLWNPTVNLTGTVTSTNAAVWVNGVKGHNNGNGTWYANGVPVNSGGTASFVATAYDITEQQPDGSYGN